MRHRRNHRYGLRGMFAALVPLCLAAPPAEAQGLREAFSEGLETLDRFFTGPLPERAPQGVRECGSLYGADARYIARRRDMLDSVTQWLRESSAVVQRVGPLPICFAFGHDTLTSNQSRRLLQVNNYYLRRHPEPYLLTGYTDRQERDLALARRRAQEIKKESPLPPCLYGVAERRGAELDYYRRVYYERAEFPGARHCRR
ncbi:MAG TPA: hypothetical protein VFR37_17145 [Longimicrobium sp.]|nr:hypothetical protein [Longimicrobium sp.]